ncbi:hypothetical protein G7085_19690 [Tessaracoccus sp. HDW20]|uniref:hypothetical protein n=1 Tax=Tessaracoccus coleopterorum TaxID=2714950 RepID=UPI0018D2E7B4|nr:hypothetical protein [Tessaracoccus coleopterorum]NHB86010.1 hypothetical protein [Tessaracoccus coleopterorum]
MTGRWPVTLLAVAGALIAGVAAQTAGSSLASLAWALAAGVGLSLMLRGFGLRIVGILLAGLAVAGIGWAAQSGQWTPLVGFVATLIASLGFVVWGPAWRHRRSTGREAPADLWKAMDEGYDPTGEQGSPDAAD